MTFVDKQKVGQILKNVSCEEEKENNTQDLKVKEAGDQLLLKDSYVKLENRRDLKEASQNVDKSKSDDKFSSRKRTSRLSFLYPQFKKFFE